MESQRDSNAADPRIAGAWLVFVCRSLAVSLEVFLHGRLGSRYLGLPGFGAAVLLALWTLGWPGYDLLPLLWFAGAYLAMCLLSRLGVFVRWLRKDIEHSYYTGRPHLLRIFPRWNELVLKRVLEPLLVCAIGIVVAQFNFPLGCYLTTASIGLALSVAITDERARTRALDLRDAIIEQRVTIRRLDARRF